MMTKKIDERKYYRFPMFDDNTPVKQVDEVVRVVLQQEFPMPLDEEAVTYTSELTKAEGDNDAPAFDQQVKNVKQAYTANKLNRDFSSQRVDKATEAPSNQPKKESLESNRQKPDFKSGYQPIFNTRANRKKPAHAEKSHRLHHQSEAKEERDQKIDPSLKKPFIPTYIPESRNRSYASLSRDEENKKVLISRFKKEQSSYLLIDDSVVEEEVSGKTNIVITPKPLFKKDKSDIPFTRREFKKLSEQERENVALPSELETKNKATGRTSRLDRGLKGILADDASKKSATRYFE